MKSLKGAPKITNEDILTAKNWLLAQSDLLCKKWVLVKNLGDLLVAIYLCRAPFSPFTKVDFSSIYCALIASELGQTSNSSSAPSNAIGKIKWVSFIITWLHSKIAKPVEENSNEQFVTTNHYRLSNSVKVENWENTNCSAATDIRSPIFNDNLSED